MAFAGDRAATTLEQRRETVQRRAHSLRGSAVSMNRRWLVPPQAPSAYPAKEIICVTAKQTVWMAGSGLINDCAP